jgi:3-deoxy-D-manno-octulosonic-acid transferase
MKTCAFIPNFFKLYNILWQAVLPFLKKNKRLSPTFEKRVTPDHLEKADIWIQSASAGEAFLALSLVSSLDPKENLKILITSTTSQGIKILESGLADKALHPHITCCLNFFPFDIPRTIQGAVKRVNPRAMILLETEIWPALLYYLKENHTQIFIINGRLSKKSGRHYKWTRFLWNKLSPDRILAISPLDAKKYGQVFENTPVTTMSNIKFDLMESQSLDALKTATLNKVISKGFALSILASIRRQEETQALKIIQHLIDEYPDQIVAIFPRHMHRLDAWKRKLKQKGVAFHLRSKVTTPVSTGGIILWDTFGELRAAYGIASAVFVGGSLQPLGGQNFIEPAALGTPTVTGPFLDDFAWVGEEIFSQKIVTRCHDHLAVARTMVCHLKTPVDRFEQRQRGRDYIQARQGGTRTACQMILGPFSNRG